MSRLATNVVVVGVVGDTLLEWKAVEKIVVLSRRKRKKKRRKITVVPRRRRKSNDASDG